MAATGAEVRECRGGLRPGRDVLDEVMGAVALWVMAMVCLGVVVSLLALESTLFDWLR